MSFDVGRSCVHAACVVGYISPISSHLGRVDDRPVAPDPADLRQRRMCPGEVAMVRVANNIVEGEGRDIRGKQINYRLLSVSEQREADQIKSWSNILHGVEHDQNSSCPTYHRWHL